MVDCALSPTTPAQAGVCIDVTVNDSTTSAMFACTMCNGVFKSQRNLDDHVRGLHQARQTYRCVMCGQSFRWRSALSNHRKRWCRFTAHEYTETHQTEPPVTGTDPPGTTEQHSFTSDSADTSDHTKGAS